MRWPVMAIIKKPDLSCVNKFVLCRLLASLREGGLGYAVLRDQPACDQLVHNAGAQLAPAFLLFRLKELRVVGRPGCEFPPLAAILHRPGAELLAVARPQQGRLGCDTERELRIHSCRSGESGLLDMDLQHG